MVCGTGSGRPADRDSETLTPGQRLGPYEISSRIGAGGMGEVWKARDTRLDRSVAIKILPAEFAQNAQLKSRLASPGRLNVVVNWFEELRGR